MAVSALTALAMTACGGGGGSSSDSDAAAQPNVLEQLAKDLKGSLQKTVEKTESSDSVTLSMQGTAAGEKITAQGVIDLRDPIKVEMTTTDSDGKPTTIRMIETAVYVEVPEADRASMGGKRWLKIDVGAAGAQAGMDFTKQLEDVDPTKQVKALLASENVTVVGEEKVNGVDTVHYTVTQSIQEYLQQVDAEMRKGAEEELAKQGVKEITIDLWVDGQYQPRRAKIVTGNLGDLTVDYTDYGKPVNIETPPAAETTDFAEMMKGLGDLTS
ncbi:hypothetical protein ACIBO1_19405 [Micromonospora sp. NPDC049903]|uniref:hypothetical protein n=1 Tax=Micromonospora sp. NPDC049903 TaxID=3364276 RepID=UPI003791A93D